jgi:hypothetical protein
MKLTTWLPLALSGQLEASWMPPTQTVLLVPICDLPANETTPERSGIFMTEHHGRSICFMSLVWIVE